MTQHRRRKIVDVFGTVFGDLAEQAPAAFRVKYRKMAADPFAFYRGSAGLFYADVTDRDDAWVDERTSRVWVHGDLHPENFGTYLNSAGRLVFDVNDFDEAYLGHFTWDLMRFAAGMALMGWQKALPEADVRELIERYVRAYLAQVDHYQASDADDFAVTLENTDGPVLAVLRQARTSSRAAMLDGLTLIDDSVRRFRDGHGVRRLDDAERREVERAFDRYLATIPPSKRYDRELFYELHDIVGKSGFGIGSAGLPAYNLLVEGFSQALDNDVVLSMKQANVPAISYFATNSAVSGYFDHEGHRTVVSQRALQAHSDQLLGYTDVDGVGYIVSEISPYVLDMEWDDINEPAEMADVVEVLGRATAKIHCASDRDSEQDLVDFQTEEAIAAVLDGQRSAFVSAMADFGVEYADQVRADHAEFVAAFREGEIGVNPR
jgi:uncharacterized protein (DUF2252 family)